MRCGKGHDHNNIEEVKACYGLPADLTVREENLVPSGPRQPGPRAELNAKRMAEEKVNTVLALQGHRHGFTSRCPRCVAGTHFPPDERDAVSSQQEEPTDRQLKFIGDLLSQRKLVVKTEVIAALTKRSASDMIGRLKDFDGPLPAGVSHDPAYQSADGDPEGYGDPKPARQTGPLPDVPEGHYAIPSLTGNNDLDFFRVDRPTEGGWKGKTYVKRVIGGKPDKNIRFSQYREVLQTILNTGIQESGMMYADKIGRCYRCNRHLTDEESRARGLGPDCASK